MKKVIQTICARYKACFSSRTFIISLLVALFMLAATITISAYAVSYATASVSSPVTDIILSNIGPYDIDGLFVNGAVAMVIFIALVCLWDPKRAPFVVKTISIFVIVRSLFIICTHIGAFPTQAMINPSSQNLIKDIIGTKLYASFFLGDDSFFSGHTGLPFLLAFLYWDRAFLRAIFIILSVMFGVVVLLGHLHYTIDVLSAFFISYGVYRLSRILFWEDLDPDCEQQNIIKEYKIYKKHQHQ